jgi:hypothetical protein
LPDLFEHGTPVEELTAISLFDSAPQLRQQFYEGGFPGLLALLEQPQPFAKTSLIVWCRPVISHGLPPVVPSRHQWGFARRAKRKPARLPGWNEFRHRPAVAGYHDRFALLD